MPMGLDWFAGMAPGGVATLQAAAAGREAKERYEASAPEGDPGFNDADWAALAGVWSWFNSVVGPAMRAGPAGMIDDDLAYVAPWGFEPSQVDVPVLLVHGGQDRIAPVAHAEWLASRIPNAELRVQPRRRSHLRAQLGARGAGVVGGPRRRLGGDSGPSGQR